MDEICFRYTARALAEDVVADLRRLHPSSAKPHLGDRRDVVHLPDALWQRALVPEITLGLGGRLTPCRPAQDTTCGVEDPEAVVRSHPRNRGGPRGVRAGAGAI